MAGPAALGAFDFIVFGGSGDLSLRKIMPALFHRDLDGELPQGARIVGTARRPMDRAVFAALVEEHLRRHVSSQHFEAATWQRFRDRLDYVAIDSAGDKGWDGLATALKATSSGSDGPRASVFYLATSPDLFGEICRKLKVAGLARPEARVVLEKPIGHDLASSRAVNAEVGAVFAEDHIFRIDHYLGKESVQNLMALRFANALFETIWNRGEIDHVQITVSETIGVAGRGAYYDGAGALRDMVQNHLLQLLCLVAMEPPTSMDSDGVRDEKVKVLTALKPIAGPDIATKTVRGQYRAGAVEGQAVAGYGEEIGRPDSATESFVAIKAEIANWRWAGVPFYLRTGKRMPERRSEIVVQFRAVPHLIFPGAAGHVSANRLVIRLQPDEGIKLHLMSKAPGAGAIRLTPSHLNLSFAETFKTRVPDAYERLLMDVARGQPTLFMRRDEVEAAWRWTESIMEGWQAGDERPKPYMAGSWGPSAAIALVQRDGRSWHEDMD
ncbi:MAG: glucose-6-phosphate dehydrogenase [Alphaproteobacteria bacterium]|nr:glucose-6-phosphate dehydrogenase [Alphaproteobacteria bacterium]